MTDYRCGLCLSSGFMVRTSYNPGTIVRMYREKLGLDVSRYFTTDELSLRQCCQCGLQSYFPAQSGDAVLYEQLQRLPLYYEEDKPEFGFARQILQQKKPENVLEVGCGMGHFLRSIKSACEVSGSEKNPDARAALLREGIPLDIESKHYDFIVAFQVLEHLADSRSFLEVLVGKLNKGGHLLLTVPNPDSLYSQTVEDLLDYPPHHMTRWSMAALENIGQFFPLQKVAEYQESLRIEHFRSIIASRRKRLVGDRLYGRIMQRMGDMFDALYMPFSLGLCKEKGHTHGIVFVKTD